MLSSISQKQISTTTTNKHIVHAEVNHDEEQINADPDSSAIAKMPPKRNKQRMRKKSKRHAHGNEQAPPSTVADDVSKPTEDRPVVHWKKAKIATCRQQSPDGNLSNTSINKDGGESQQTTSQQESRDTHDKSDSPPLPNCNPQRGKQLHLHVRKNESLVEIPSGMKMVDGRQVHVITCLPSGSNKQLINMEGDEIMTKTIPADERPGVNLNDSSDGNDIKGFEKGCHQDFAITESGHGDDNLGSKTAVKKRATPFPFAPKFTFTPLGSGKRCSPSCPRCEARINGPKLELHPAHKSKLRRDHGKSICDKFSAKVKALYERRWYHRENREPAYFSDKCCPKEVEAYNWRLKNPTASELIAAQRDGHDTSKSIPREYVRVDEPLPLPLPGAVRFGDEPLPSPEELNCALMESLQEATLELPTAFYF